MLQHRERRRGGAGGGGGRGCFSSFAPLPVPPSSSQSALIFFIFSSLCILPFCIFSQHPGFSTSILHLMPPPRLPFHLCCLPSLLSIFLCWGEGVCSERSACLASFNAPIKQSSSKLMCLELNTFSNVALFLMT